MPCFINVLTLIFISITVCFGQSSEKIDSIVRAEMDKRNIPGMSLAIIKDDSIIHKKAYGYSVLEHQVPTKLETVFELASVSKQFIATGILLLVQDGLLDLDSPIHQYLDSIPVKWRDITTRQLLSHTAGLAPMEDEWKSLKEPSWPKYVSREMLLDAAIQDKMIGPPGGQFRYHNMGYSLSVLIIENITGKDHRDFFKDRIFDPLGMSCTYFEDQLRITPNLAQGYTIKDGNLIRIWRVGQEEVSVGDGLDSCIDDLIRWNFALNNNEVLQPTIQREMFRQIKLENSSDFRYGLGWWLPTRNRIRYYYHNGVTGPEFLKIPSENLDIIILSNLGQGEYDDVYYWGIADRVAGELIDQFKYDPIVTSVSKKLIKKFAGQYEYESGGDLRIFIKEGQLYLKDSFGESLMVYIENQTFQLIDSPVIFEFINPNRILIKDETWNDDYANRVSE